MSKQKPYRLFFTLGCLGVSFLFYFDISKLFHTSQDIFSSVASQVDVESTINFGKTHFILGYPHDKNQKKEQSQSKSNVEQQSYTQFVKAYFSPDDSVRDVLVRLIQQEKKSISIAAFTFTERQIADALIEAKKRGIMVQLITDPTGINDRYNKIIDMADHKIDIYVYNYRHKSGKTGLMHNKFIIFGKNELDKALVWTGSCNFTRAATQDNQENVVVVGDVQLVDRYEEHYQKLLKRCDRFYVSNVAGKRTVHMESRV